MCGIAGIVDWGGRDPDAMLASAIRMQEALTLRGPDGSGHATRRSPATGATAYLVHRRLAIIDTSEGGRQPMASADQAHWVTFNGEIYNYQDLRHGSSLEHVSWTSTSDTEVLVEGLARHGLEWLSGLRGMFALGWWNERPGQLVLARDRFGIKPLVWTHAAPDLVLFASTPQALAASGLVTLVPRDGSDTEFLARGSTSRTNGFWQGIHVVPPGHAVVCEGASGPTGECRTRVSRWAPDARWLDRVRSERSVQDVGAEVEAALRDSVRAHFVSDVPVALFLSGGRDSVALLAAAHALQDVPLRTFTVTMPGSRLDEAAHARAAAAHFGADHTELALVDLDLDASLDAFFEAMPRPSVDGFNTFLVARAASQAGIRVALSGIGGDELFGGYPSFTDVPRLHTLLQRGRGAWQVLAPLLSRWPTSRLSRLGDVARAAPTTLADVWWQYRGLWSDPDVRALTGRAAPGLAGRTEGSIDSMDDCDPFDVIRNCEWHHFLERQLLPDADAYTMCHGLELRTPFVDPVMVDAVLSAGRWSRAGMPSFKQSLFEAMPALTLPALRDAPKRGFVLPFDAWLRQALQPHPSHWGDVSRRLDRPEYRPLVERFLKGRLHWSRIWALYVRERVTR